VTAYHSPSESTFKRIRWRMNPINIKMKGWKGKNKYQLLSFLHELILFFINYFLSFALHVRIIILCFVYSDEHKHTTVYSFLRKKDFPSSCIFYLDLFPSFEPYEDHDVHILILFADNPSCKPIDTKVDLLPHEILVVPGARDLTPHVGRIIYSNIIKVNINKA
jgi:hypothetical protein